MYSKEEPRLQMISLVHDFDAIHERETGIAATLINSITTHKQFSIPVPCNEHSTSHIRLNSKEAAKLREASLIIWNESSMSH